MPSNWATAPLGDLVIRLTEKNEVGESNVLTISARKGLVNQRDYFNKNVASKDLSSYFLLRRGDFAYNKSKADGYPLGAIKRLDLYPAGVVSPLYICFRLTDEARACSDFLAHFFESGLLNAELRAIAKEGARSHGLLNVKPTEFLALPVRLPPLAEQRKIAAILSSVDVTIEKTEAVIAQLDLVKKMMLEELLARGIPGRHSRFKQTEIGEVPEEWELTTIGEAFDTTSGGTPNRDTTAYWGGGIPWVKTGEIDYRLITSTEERITDVGLANSSAKLLPPGTLLMALYGQGATRGRVAILGIEAATNQACLAFLSRGRVLTRLLFWILASRYQELRSIGNNGAQKNLSAGIVRNLSIPVPPPSEQVEIAAALEVIENRIMAEDKVRGDLIRVRRALSEELLSGRLRLGIDPA